jgi:hypothetical protein
MEVLKFCYIYPFVDETKAGKSDGGRKRRLVLV